MEVVNLELDKRKQKKEQNNRLNYLLTRVNINMTDKTKLLIKDCGTFLEFLGDKDLKNFKLSGANFCKNRFCPHCNYNQARKLTATLKVLMDYLKNDYSFIFLTLTAPNVPSYKLGQELKDYYKSFDLLFKYKKVKKISKGYIRKFEITYNAQRDDYHPHYHVMIAVNPSYFKSRDYLSQQDWLNLWRKAKRDYSIVSVDVRKVDDKNVFKSILELSKYLSKDSDYLHSEKVFKVFYDNLKGKRYMAYSGAFREAKKLFDSGDLDYLKDIDTIKYIYKIYYIWSISDYSIKQVIEMSEEEQAKFNYQFKNEEDIE